MNLKKYFTPLYDAVFYPNCNYEFDMIYTLESLCVDKYIFCDFHNHIDINLIENKIGLKGLEIIKIRDVRKNDFKDLIKKYNGNYELFKWDIESLFSSKGFYIKEFKLRLNPLKVINLLYVVSDVLNVYNTLFKITNKNIPIIINSLYDIDNAEGSIDIINKLNENDLYPDVIWTTEFEEIDKYILNEEYEFSDEQRVLKKFVKEEVVNEYNRITSSFIKYRFS